MGINVRSMDHAEGVTFDLEVDGVFVVAVAPADYLARRHGAIDEPGGCLQTYRRHEAEIDGDVRTIVRERGRRTVVLSN